MPVAGYPPHTTMATKETNETGAVGELAAQGRCDSKERVSFCLGIDIVKNWHPIPN